jgi:hypothetical protein
MNALTDLAAPFTWTCTGLAALLFLAGIPESRRPVRTFGGLLALLAAVALTIALAHPQFLPARSAAVHADGSTEDPRVLSALLVSALALVALLPAWRSLRLPAMGAVGLALPGIVFAGLFGAVASFARLQQPLALAGIALGTFAGVTALVLAARARGHAPLALQAFATAVLAVAGMLSLHGARLGSVSLAEGAALDTLGRRIQFAGVDAPAADRRVLRVVLYGVRDSLLLRPELLGSVGRNVQSVADAGLLSGPIVVPIALEERRARPHDLQWVDRTTPLQAGGATIRLAGFRFVPGDTIRMYADLDVTTAAGTRRVSPGVYASATGELPFSATAEGFGPIAVARIDADHGRVGLMLPQLSEGVVSRTAALDLRLRPGLPIAWAGLAFALVAFVFSLAVRGGTPARR